MCIQATAIFTPVFYVCIKWWNFEKRLHSYKKQLLPLQTECTTEDLWINRHICYSLCHLSLTLTPAQLHFLSFSALLCSSEAVHCRLYHLGPSAHWPLIGFGQWEAPAKRPEDQRREIVLFLSYSPPVLLSPCFSAVFLAIAISCHDYSLLWGLVTLILPLVLLPWKRNSFHQLPVPGCLDIPIHHSVGNPFT